MEDVEYEYNYVICGAGGFYLVGYHDIMNHPQVRYFDSYGHGFKTRIQQILLRLCFSKLINKYIKTPFSSYIFPRLYPYKFDNSKPICFLFFRNHEQVYATGYINYLRKMFPTCKTVLFLQDIVRLKTNFTFELVRDKFDIILSYDQKDAKDFNLLYHPTPMSYLDIPPLENTTQSDLYFCGRAKNRYKEIVTIYKFCKELGLKCDFNVIDLSNEGEQIEGINYPDHYFTYMENLQHVKNTRCILEIMQQGAEGFTPRLWESIVYDCHLISNNASLLDSAYKDLEGLHVYNGDLGSLNIKEWINTPISYPSSLKHSLSPLHLLKFIDQNIISK